MDRTTIIAIVAACTILINALFAATGLTSTLTCSVTSLAKEAYAVVVQPSTN